MHAWKNLGGTERRDQNLITINLSHRLMTALIHGCVHICTHISLYTNAYTSTREGSILRTNKLDNSTGAGTPGLVWVWSIQLKQMAGEMERHTALWFQHHHRVHSYLLSICLRHLAWRPKLPLIRLCRHVSSLQQTLELWHSLTGWPNVGWVLTMCQERW